MGELTTIVRWLDDALNNTSLVLLIEAAGKRMLFPGDAQIENWGWALKQVKEVSSVRTALRDIDLLKVGHHGSRNGTPRSLHALWVNAAIKKKRVALLSTRKGVHGKTDATAVPRLTLLQGLNAVADVYSTDTTDEQFVEAVGKRGVDGFSVTGAEPLRPEGLVEPIAAE